MEELDLKYLQYALAVVRYGSVTQAARALYLAQPNLSRAIGELEQSLGFPLFLRTRQGMSLTPQGERFLTEAETLLDRLSDLARECRQESRRRVHFACVPSSLFVNTVLETARGLPDWSIQCEEYYDCRELFDRVGKGASLAAFLTFGTEMREELFAYFARRNLRYHPLAQSPAYGVVRRTSSLYHPETVPPSIRYDEALLMLNVTYFDPIGVHFQPERSPRPPAKGICHGVGRAGNLDMLESMDHLVMISCHIHSKIMARNELAAVPIRPAFMDYEYGFLTRADVRLSLEEQALLEKIEGEVQREFEA